MMSLLFCFGKAFVPALFVVVALLRFFVAVEGACSQYKGVDPCPEEGKLEVANAIANSPGDPPPDTSTAADPVVQLQLVATLPERTGSSRPMAVINDGVSRNFAVDQRGYIWEVVDDVDTDPTVPFLDITNTAVLDGSTNGQVSPVYYNFFEKGFQIGLSSAAFHPDFYGGDTAPGYGKLYVAAAHGELNGYNPDFATSDGEATHISAVHEFQYDFVADTFSLNRAVLTLSQTCNDHEMGTIAFRKGAVNGDDDYGMLYIGIGDGGCPADPFLKSQDKSSPLGSMLRIDPTTGNPDPNNPFFASSDLAERMVYAYGFRNPHLFAWDDPVSIGGTGALLLSDIGQLHSEEINVVEAGENYGWGKREGIYQICYGCPDQIYEQPDNDVDASGQSYTYPAVIYNHKNGDNAISGGSVYRGSQIPGLQDYYVLGDLASGRTFAVPIDTLLDAHTAGTVAPLQALRLENNVGQEITFISQVDSTSRTDLRFGEGFDGEIFVVSKQGGYVFKFVPPFVPPCNNNGTCDVDEDCNTCNDCVNSGTVETSACGNGVCEPDEDCNNCSSDCAGQQTGKPANRFCCGFEDSNCMAGTGSCSNCGDYTSSTTINACCGDNNCEAPLETSSNCARDCTPAASPSPAPVASPSCAVAGEKAKDCGAKGNAVQSCCAGFGCDPGSKNGSCRPSCDGSADIIQVGSGYLNGVGNDDMSPYYDYVDLPADGISGAVDFRRTETDSHPFELCSAEPVSGACPAGTSLGAVLTNDGDCTTVDTRGLTEFWSVCTVHPNMVDEFQLAS